ncbi:MAG: hypothetical protein INR73_25310 [Williamsia sp.]|nr:hypothetical protein [Williamsia sp.]
MHLHYLILAHTNLSQLDRLVKTLADDRTHLFIHIDKKISWSELSKFDFYHNKRVELVKERFSIRWGGYNMVRATLTLMKTAVLKAQKGYFILISGQDYPLKSNQFIYDYLRQRQGAEYMTHWSIPYENWSSGGLSRIRYSWFIDQIGFTASKLLYYFQKCCKIKRTYLPAQLPYGGSQWWCLTHDCVNYILAFVDHHPAFRRFYEHTLIADEMFFQTIVLNSPFRDSVVNNNLRYIKFDGLNTHPNVLDRKDLPGLLASDKLWARKFDENHDIEVMNNLEQQLKG